MVVDHTKETRRAEQISGGVTIDHKGAASDAELIARQQAEIVRSWHSSPTMTETPHD